MTKEQLLDCVAPCGLMCYTCPGFCDGAIREHSAALLRLREGFREFLEKRYTKLTEYDQYIEGLKADSNPTCPGCRKSGGEDFGCIKGCFIAECAKEHSVDFCGECIDFPCKRVEESSLFGEEAKKGFYEGSLLIKAHGALEFFEMKKDISHYMNYVK